MYRVTRGRDMSFLPISASDRALDYSRFDVGGAASADHPGELSGYLFSDRGLYRPGETLHIGVIVRAADWARSVAGIPLEAEVVNPRGDVVKTVPLTLDRSGFTELSYRLADTAATGSWAVNLHLRREGATNYRIGGTTVAVKAFRPDRMKVAASLTAGATAG